MLLGRGGGLPPDPRGTADGLSRDTDWEEIRELVTGSYRMLAPKKLTALLD